MFNIVWIRDCVRRMVCKILKKNLFDSSATKPASGTENKQGQGSQFRVVPRHTESHHFWSDLGQSGEDIVINNTHKSNLRGRQ